MGSDRQAKGTRMEKLKVLETIKIPSLNLGEICRISVWITASLAFFVIDAGCVCRGVSNGSREKLRGVSLNSVDPVSEESAILAKYGRRKIEPAARNTSDILTERQAR